MLKIKSLALATVLGLTAISAASAQTYTIHVTGSTAYRNATVSAICEVLYNQAPGPSPVSAAYSGSSLVGSSYSVIYGPTVAGVNYIVECSFSGSVGGLQTLTGAGSPIATFPSASAYASSALPVSGLDNVGTAVGGGYSISGTVTDDAAVAPDLTLSDVYKASTPYNLSSIKETTVGVVPFKFIVGNGAPARLSNMTNQIARYLFTVGTISLASFTGNASDMSSTVVAIGRDNDSGTRLTAFAETGVGVATTVNQQYPLNAAGNPVGISSAVGPITSYEQVPQSTVNGFTLAPGNGGYSSGGNLATALGSATTESSFANPTYFVSYLGYSDSVTAEGTSTPATELTYDGVAFSPAAIENGSYTYWGYEHLDYLSTINNGTSIVAKFVTALKNDLNAGDDKISADGINALSMIASRSTDGGTVIP
jgi:hypothetical protein